MKKCIEKGCNGNIDPSKVFLLQTGCHHHTHCPTCDVCGAVYYPDGGRMYQRGWTKKPFYKDGKFSLKPTDEEEVRSVRVDDAISILKEDGYPDDVKESALNELRAVVLREHTKDCHLQKGIGACTCGISFAKEYLEKIRVN
ncbi:MAG: hypothetical protein AB1333_00205 [Patescibacteria group bacterium]